MRILTWNINGLATTLQYYPWSETKSYETLLNALEADIICLQEIKCQRSKMTRDMALVPGYDGYFSFSKVKHGYSGVAVYVKQPLAPVWTEEGITGINRQHALDPEMVEFLGTLSTEPAALDAEGRCIITDFKAFVLFNIYFPNETSEARRDFKMDYHHCVRKRIDLFLKQGRQVILAGDINAVHEEIDHCDPQKSLRDNDITDFKALPHRQWLDQLIAPKGPLIDLCRRSHPDRRGMYTCWNTRLNARPANYGTRIDYVLASQGLSPWFQYADIQPNIMGSDHCPVYADFGPHSTTGETLVDSMTSDAAEREPSVLLASNFSEFSNRQKKLSTYFTSGASTPTSSGKTISKADTLMTDNRASPPQPSLSSEKPKSSLNSPKNSTPLSRKRAASQSGTVSPGQKLLKSFFQPNSTQASPREAELSDKSSVEQEEMVDFEVMFSERQETQQSWSSLFKARPVPRCTVHNEPCKEMTVTKKGPNKGRQFYLCARAIGPENDTSNAYQCNFFQWKYEKPDKKSR